MTRRILPFLYLFLLVGSSSAVAQTWITWNTPATSPTGVMTGTANLGSYGIVTVTLTVSTGTGNYYAGADNNSGLSIGNAQTGLTTFRNNASTAGFGTIAANQVVYTNHTDNAKPNIFTLTFDKPVKISQLLQGDIEASDDGTLACSSHPNDLLVNWDDGFVVSGTTFSSNATANLSVVDNTAFGVAGTSTRVVSNTGMVFNGPSSQEGSEITGDNLISLNNGTATSQIVIAFNGEEQYNPSCTGIYVNKSGSNAITFLSLQVEAACSATVAPTLNTTTLTELGNLSSLTASNTPSGTTLKFYSSATPSAGTELTGAALTAAPAGTYYAAFYDATNNCWGPVTTVTVLMDTDGDGIPNTTDLDDDNDGVLDIDEDNACTVAARNVVTNGTFTGLTNNYTTSGGIRTNISSTTSPTWTARWTSTSGAITSGDVNFNDSPTSITNPNHPGMAIGVDLSSQLYPTSNILLQNNLAMNIVNGERYIFNADMATFNNTTPNGAYFEWVLIDATGAIRQVIRTFNTANGSGGSVTVPKSSTLTTYTNSWHSTLPTGNYFLALVWRPLVANANNINDLYVDNIQLLKPCDTDGDGIPNTRDVDSDNDGCPDSFESGTTTNRTSTTIPGPYGANGFANSIETNDTQTAAYTGTYTYSNATSASTVSCCPTTPTVTPTTATGCGSVNLASLAVSSTAPAGTKLVWSTSATPTALSDTLSNKVVTTSGTYYAYYLWTSTTDATKFCFGTSDNVVVTINPIPAAPTGTGAASPTICSGQSTALNGTCATGTLTWYTDAALTTTIASPVSPTATTTYYGACVSAAGCKSPSAQVTVTVNPTPTTPSGAAAGSNPICSGQSTTLSGTCTTGTITWYTDAALTTTTAATVSPSVNTTYYGACVSAAGCKSGSASVQVTVNPTPTPPTGASAGTNPICSGQSTTLIGTCSTGTISWYSNATLTTAVTSPVSPTTTTTYYASCVSAAGCKSASASVQITVNPTPTPPTGAAASPATICSGNSTTLSATCATGTVTWYTNTALTATTSATVSPTANTTYYAACVTPEGCKSTSTSVSVTVNTTPDAPTGAAASSSTICSGSSTTLSATCVSGSRTWYTDAALTNTTSTTVSPTTTTTYYVVCLSAEGCKSSPVSVVVTVNPTPAIPTGTGAASPTICSGQSTALNGACSTGTLTWYTDAALTNTVASPVSPTVNTTYYGACVSAAGCKSASATVSVTVNPTPTIPTGATASPAVICSGNTTTLSATCASGTVTWYTDAALTTTTTASVSPTTTTTYYAVCVTTEGCKSSSANVEVTVSPTPPVPTRLLANPTSVCIGQPSALSGTCATGTLTWYTDAALTTITSSIVTPSVTTTYYAACVSTAGCKSAYGSVTVVSTGSCNIPPVALNDIAVTPQDKPVTGNVLTNDFDPDGQPLTISTTPTSQPTKGTVTLNSNGTYTYTPNSGQTGEDTFCYQVNDGAGGSDISCVTIEIVPNPTSGNDAPIASNDNVFTEQNTPITIDIKANDNDPDGPGLGSPTILTQPANGTVSMVDGKAVYTPNPGFTGTDSFTYKICDNGSPALCDEATATIEVIGEIDGNNPPTAMDDAKLTPTGTPVSGTVAANDLDSDNSTPLTFTKTTNPTNGTVTFDAQGNYTYTPNPGFVGNDSFTYTVCDAGSPVKCDVATISIAVLPSRTKVALSPKVWLQGALFGVTSATGVMRDDLRAKGLLPTTSPYALLNPVTPTGTVAASVFAVTGNDAIVDWVFVELRDGITNTNVRDSRAALVQRDGDIVDLDGTSNITFDLVNSGSYYVVVKHRNHLGVMSESAVPLTDAATTIDFRQSSTPNYNIDAQNITNVPQVTVAQGKALWAGNVVYDNKVIYQGTTNDVDRIYQLVISSSLNILNTPFYKLRTYNVGDVNMNGETVFQGTGNDVEYIYLNVMRNHFGNTLQQPFFIIREQLP